MKNIILSLLLALGMVFNSQAVNVVTTVVTNGTTPAGNSGNPIITNGPILLYKLSIAYTNGSASAIQFFDSPNQKITNNNPAYTIGVLTTNIYSYAYTNIAGVSESTTITNLIMTNATYAATNYTYRPLLTLTLTPTNSTSLSSTLVYIPVEPLLCIQGLMATNALNGAIVTAEYSNYR